MQQKGIGILFTTLIFILGFSQSLSAQTNIFSYQGSLNNGGTAANGSYDFEFALFDSYDGGNQVGTTISRNGVAVTNGIFAVQLDFGVPSFPGAGRYLEIRVRPAGQPGITILTPRQLIDSSPYAMKSLNADTATTATNAMQLGGTAANQFVVTTDPRMTDARTPTAGSGDYVQNRATPQAATNFNISGSGTVGGTLAGNIVRANTQFNIGNNRVLSIDNSSNLFVGVNSGNLSMTGTANTFVGSGSGASNTTGFSNTFVGNTGSFNTTGNENSFFGYAAGSVNTTGNDNSFFGRSAGHNNSTGSSNSYFGYAAGYLTTTAGNNSFFGYQAGYNNLGGGNSYFGANAGHANTTGSANSFFGVNAGESNTTGLNNTFFGANAGAANTTALGNSFFGANAGAANVGQFNSFFGGSSGLANTTGFYNSFFGTVSGVANTTGNSNSFFGHWAGHDNTTGDSNSFFGTFAGESNTTGIDNTYFGRSAGESSTTASHNAFFGRNAGSNNTTGYNNSFIGKNAGIDNTTGTNDTFIGNYAGENNTTGNSNSFFGSFAGNTNTTGSNNTIIGAGADVSDPNLTFATAIGGGSVVSASNTIVIGRTADRTQISGNLRLMTFAVGSTDICVDFAGQIGFCSSSLRYKTSVESYDGGLDIVRRLRPITFRWKDGGAEDIGFGAEEVADVEPRLVLRNADGRIEGVKYRQITTVLVNAVKEQQAEIVAQAEVIRHQQRQIDALLKLTCAANAAAEICKEKK